MKILIASSVCPQAIEILKSEHDVICAFGADTATLKELIVDRDILMFRSGVQITAEVMDCAENLQLILRAGSGTDNLDLNYVREQGIPLVRIPGPGAQAVAEMAFAMMLALARNIPRANDLTRSGRWAKTEMTGHLLRGKTLGVVGAGNIGSRTALMGHAWGMSVMGCVAHHDEPHAVMLAKQGAIMADLDELLAHSDFVCLHVPLAAATRNLMGAAEFARMKQDSFLVNLARGGVVDEQALLDSLVAGHIRGAALDVHSDEGEGKVSPLAALDNVILTPHIGASTFDSQREIGEIAIDSINRFINGEPLRAVI